MSIKRRVQYKSRSFFQFFGLFTLPSWCESALVRVGLVSILIVLSVAYIAKTNSSATSGYELARLENQINALNREVSNLEIQKTSYESMHSIEARLSEIKMTTPQKIDYVLPAQPLVARR